jgi:serine/threonine protein kinase
MVLEYCNQGNLMSYQSKLPNKRYPLKEASEVLMDVVKGLKVIH